LLEMASVDAVAADEAEPESSTTEDAAE
jgi:hypothetical protein